MSKAPEARIGDFVSLQRGTTYKSMLLGEPGPVLLGLASIQRNGGFRSDSLRTYGGESTEKLLLNPGDLYVSLKDVTQSADLLGAVARVPSNVTVGRLTQDTVKLTFDKAEVSRDYIYWILRTPQYREYCRAKSIGTTNLSLTRDDFLSYPIPLLSRERAALVEALGALDDKIAVNDHTSVISLDLAESCYLQAASSPSCYRVTLGAAARWFSGGTPKTSEPSYWGGDLPWISASSLKSPWIDDSDRKLTDSGAFAGTCIVPARSVIFVVRGSSLKTEFRVGVTQCKVAFGQDCKALVALDPIDPHVLFHAIRSSTPEILEMVDETSIGAGRLSTDLISKLEVRVPQDTGGKLTDELRSLDNLASSLQQESRTLAALRDSLLPYLMSGKLRVRDAERIVEDVV